MKAARNAPCSCGSGKKYKHCHGAAVATQNRRWSVYAMMLVGLALLVGMGGFIYGVVSTPEPTDGRVWSAEHGHWHGADGRELGGSSGPPAGMLAPQPPGPAPAGKVWSPEHGHWHDA